MAKDNMIGSNYLFRSTPRTPQQETLLIGRITDEETMFSAGIELGVLTLVFAAMNLGFNTKLLQVRNVRL